MLKKCKKSIALTLVLAMLLGCSFTVSAAVRDEDTTYIELFDPDAPSLIAIETPSPELARAASRPTAHYNLDSGQYSYSLTASPNGTKLSWCNRILDTQDGGGGFLIKGNGTYPVYILRVYNCDNGKEYTYRVLSKNFTCYNSNFNITPSSFYFGIDVSATNQAVTVSGVADTY